MSPSLVSRFFKPTPTPSAPTATADDKSRHHNEPASSAPAVSAPAPSNTPHLASTSALSLSFPQRPRATRLRRALSRRAARIARAITDAFEEEEDDHDAYARITRLFLMQYLTKQEMPLFLASLGEPAGSSGSLVLMGGRSGVEIERGGVGEVDCLVGEVASEAERPLSPLLPPLLPSGDLLRRPFDPPHRAVAPVEEEELWGNPRGEEEAVAPVRARVRAPARVVRFALPPPSSPPPVPCFVRPVPARDGGSVAGGGRRVRIGEEEEVEGEGRPFPRLGEMVAWMEELGASLFEEGGEAAGWEGNAVGGGLVARLEGLRGFFGEDE